jgi:succinate-semialdehyde dehydrogenase/glutarate-semialdehyde dehydrogenase
VRQSGMAAKGSRYGLEDYLEMKYVLFGGLGA